MTKEDNGVNFEKDLNYPSAKFVDGAILETGKEVSKLIFYTSESELDAKMNVNNTTYRLRFEVIMRTSTLKSLGKAIHTATTINERVFNLVGLTRDHGELKVDPNDVTKLMGFLTQNKDVRVSVGEVENLQDIHEIDVKLSAIERRVKDANIKDGAL